MKKHIVIGALAGVASAVLAAFYFGVDRPIPSVVDVIPRHEQSEEHTVETKQESEAMDEAVADNAEAQQEAEDEASDVAEDEQAELRQIGTPSSFEEDSVMVAIFGDYNESERGTLIPKALTENWNIQQAKWLITPIVIAEYEEGGIQKAVAVVQREQVEGGEVVEASTPKIGVYIFRWEEPRWYIVKGADGEVVLESEWTVTEAPEEPEPYFDCGQAMSEREQTICELQEAERKLADVVEGLEKSLDKTRVDWLQEAQRNWLALRLDCGYWVEDCLLHSRARAKELELGVFVNPVPPARMPYKIVLPNGVEGEFEFVTNGDRPNQVELWFSHGTERRRVWSGDGSAEGTTRASLSLIALQGDKLVLEIAVEEDAVSFYYLAMDSSGNFVFQGQKRDHESGGAGIDHYQRQWVAGADVQRLKIDRLFNGAYKNYGFEYFHMNDQQRMYRFRFDGSPWKEDLPEPQRWMDSPDAASRYLALYREIAAEQRSAAEATRTDCIEGGVNWTLAVNSLNHWFEVVLAARDRGVAYGQAATIFTKVMASSERPAFSEGDLEFFHALDYFRRRIEAKEGWERSLEIAYREASRVRGEESAQDGQDAYETGDVDSGAEVPYGEKYEIECLAEDGAFYENQYGWFSNYNRWFTNFWVRRYGDGTYEVAKRIIDYALRSQPRR